MNKATYEQELEARGFLIYTTVGRSMRPFLRSGEDLFRIEAASGQRCRQFDVVLYRRDNGRYVLHRIVKVHPDCYTLCGDNTWQLERGIRDDQILGTLTAVIRRGETIDVSHWRYRLLVRLWWMLYPPRAAFICLRGKMWILWEKIKGKKESR